LRALSATRSISSDEAAFVNQVLYGFDLQSNEF